MFINLLDFFHYCVSNIKNVSELMQICINFALVKRKYLNSVIDAGVLGREFTKRLGGQFFTGRNKISMFFVKITA